MNFEVIKSDGKTIVPYLKDEDSLKSLEYLIAKEYPCIRPYVYFDYLGDKLIHVKCTLLGRYMCSYKKVLEYDVVNLNFKEFSRKIATDIKNWAVFLDNVANAQGLLNKMSNNLTILVGAGFEIVFELNELKNNLNYMDRDTVVIGITLESLQELLIKTCLFTEDDSLKNLIKIEEVHELVAISSNIFDFLRKVHKTALGQCLDLRIRQTPTSIIRKYHPVNLRGNLVDVLDNNEEVVYSYNLESGAWE